MYDRCTRLYTINCTVCLDKIMYESKMNVQRVCRKYRAIPRFCDFVTGSSQELFELFSDIKNLFFKTGYILQQCALANNIAHFKMVMESVSCTDEDLNYQDPETGEILVHYLLTRWCAGSRVQFWQFFFLKDLPWTSPGPSF